MQNRLRIQLPFEDQSHEVYYEWISPSDSPVILVFLHDAIGSVSQWKNFPHELCAALGLPGLSYDRQGHGKSDGLTRERGANYMHHYAWEELEQVIAQLAPEKKLILIGHSDGGSIALLYASRHPQKVKAVVTMAAHVFVEEITLEGILETRQLFTSGDWLEKLSTHHGEKTKQIFNAWHETWTSDQFRNWNITAVLPFISSPALIIQGEDDNYGTEKQVDEIMEHISSVTKEKWMIPAPCGHAPWKKKPKELIEKIKLFLQQI
jgi:pimeloyl-ACP methyl ester carboxylesterase